MYEPSEVLGCVRATIVQRTVGRAQTVWPMPNGPRRTSSEDVIMLVHVFRCCVPMTADGIVWVG